MSGWYNTSDMFALLFSWLLLMFLLFIKAEGCQCCVNTVVLVRDMFRQLLLWCLIHYHVLGMHFTNIKMFILLIL
jgi:hypothetical protein